MPVPVCALCGTEYEDAPPPEVCAICADDRQYVLPSGQNWTSREALTAKYANTFKELEPGLIAIAMTPKFAIGQQALLVMTPAGNVLWDCVPLIDPATARIIEALGGLSAIAISHPHYYSAMVSWSDTLGGVPIHLHEDDRAWVMRGSDRIDFWSGDALEILPGVTMVRTGGHFAGSCVLHWAGGADGRGAVLCGDTLQVNPDCKRVSFMRSYPSYIPLSAKSVERLVGRIAPYDFDRLYGPFAGKAVLADARAALMRSADVYIEAVSGRGEADREA